MKPIIIICLCFGVVQLNANESIARKWNEVLLEAIRNDFARPTVHARNLFHISAGMYDAWSMYDPTSTHYFLNGDNEIIQCEVGDFTPNKSVKEARNETISYVAYNLIKHRFLFSPGVFETYKLADSLMSALGYDKDFTSMDYHSGSPAALGNYIAECIIQYGLKDGSNEENDYENQFYEPINPPLLPDEPGNPDIVDPNRWQPLTLEVNIDQSGNEIPATADFLSPEWGNVKPFSLSSDQMEIFERGSDKYHVFLDPGSPPYIDNESGEYYKWGFSMVSTWSSHLDPTDGVIWDISPGSIGNIQAYPNDYEEFSDFYNYEQGGDPGLGHSINPVSNQPYPQQLVPRGDYTRVLAEFWADGPDSETPPGHWFTILNYVSDHPLLEKKIRGIGKEVSDLEWDIKSYFLLGGTMHDVAITSWSLKGYYDYIRPISALRYMSDQGQSTDETLSNYNENGIPLVEGFVEVVSETDPLAGASGENIGKIKLYAWKGPAFINDPEIDEAGVDWILAENWWPYQRPSFVTPPFAGYVSGHSTYSQAAAVVLTSLTGDGYFPGGVGEFIAAQNEFLVFEEGPSVDVVLQWATYKDAADQCSLSRIWGGIHPPADDIPGRKIGMLIGHQAFDYAIKFFDGLTTGLQANNQFIIYPNPVKDFISLKGLSEHSTIHIRDVSGRSISKRSINPNDKIDISSLPSGIYVLEVFESNKSQTYRFIK